MKYVFIVLILAGGYYFYTQYQQTKPKADSINGLIDSGQPVLASYIFEKADNLAVFTCNDASYQQALNSNVSKCNEHYSKVKAECKNTVFPDLNKKITDKTEANSLMKKYVQCAI